ncbi:MAG TPA: type I DNA topoisomerase [Planctomycetota bacterium]|jgi:DNA topoisomerase-1|nr:type I DNA topoisomerase [Planctomycetota bacterium]
MTKAAKKKPTATTEAPPAPKKAPARPKKAKAPAPEPVEAPADEEPAEEAEAGPKRKGKALVIVESPAKAKTINKYLGSGFVVKASMGHVRDLPKGKFGIDVEHGFEPSYTAIRGKTQVISELKRLAKNASSVFLAPDPDREGEAIAWHLSESLDVPESRVFRVVFNEITKKAILEAFEHPGKLNMDKVDAQQARRVLDRIMGYKLSPLLWKKIARGLSAGRVQSVAVRLIVEREKEIRAFVKEEYWRVGAQFRSESGDFVADLKRLGEDRIDKNLDEKRAREVVSRIGADPLRLAELDSKPKTRRPTPPFTTSQLQQKSSTMLRFSAKKTMVLAQQLYEGVEVPGEGSVGLITYMRTDSVRVSQDALTQVRELIGKEFGEKYVPEQPNLFTAKAMGAQEAHEAIRPTDAIRTPDSLKEALTGDQLKLYTLIWQKFVSSQMPPQVSTVTTATFEHGDARFVAQGEVELFDGHTRVFDATKGERELQALPVGLQVGSSYPPEKIEATQHFTQPAPRYTEATLVKELEKRGIGRPSTYAAIISTIQDRGYVTLKERRFEATELGEIVTDQLVAHFKEILDTDFTAGMEADLDRIESGERQWRKVVKTFHDVFAADLEKAEKDMKNLKLEPKLSERLCDKCGAPMAEKFNKRGKFLGCSRYPECKNTMPTDGPRAKSESIPTDKTCEKCGKPMVIRTGSRGRFIACTGFPDCKNTASVDDQGNVIKPKETGIACEKCGKPMVIKGSRRGPFLACTGFPKCRNAKNLPPELREAPQETGEKCDKCGEPMILKRSRWGKEFLACSAYPACKNARNVGAPAGAEPAAAESDEGAPAGISNQSED